MSKGCRPSMPSVSDLSAIPIALEIVLQCGYQQMNGHQLICHICCAMLQKLDMIFINYSKFM